MFVSKGILNFKNLEDYASLLGESNETAQQVVMTRLDEISSFKSLKSAFLERQRSGVSARTANEIEEDELADSDEFISTLINEDGLIRIEDYFFNIDVLNDQVYALNTTYETDMADLINAQYQTNSNILVYSTNDDVLDILYPNNAIARLGSSGKSELFCRESGAGGRESSGYAYYVDPVHGFDPQIRSLNKVVYQKIGIYFSLLAKTKAQIQAVPTFGSLWLAGTDPDQRISFSYRFKPKCRDERSGAGVVPDGWFGQ